VHEPKLGSIRLFLDMPNLSEPMILSHPIFAEGRPTSVGWSKLCHNGGMPLDGAFGRTTRFPVFMRRTMLLLVLLAIVPLVVQTTV
jgi:hypothetical protein